MALVHAHKSSAGPYMSEHSLYDLQIDAKPLKPRC